MTIQTTLTEQSAQPSWADPWYRLRDMTTERNDVEHIASQYAKITRIAQALYNELRERPKVKQDTLDGLLSIVQFAERKATPLWQKLIAMDKAIETETERLNNG